jgi:uncharacterized protein (UPF0548 family)
MVSDQLAEVCVVQGSDVTYAEIGASATLPMPAGYHHLTYRLRLGAVPIEAVGEAVVSFALHRAAGIRIVTGATRAAVGVRLTVVVGVGPVRLTAPCEVVAVFEEPDRRGFAYGTLPGHPESGEEAFFVTRDAHGDVWFEARSFSRPASWFTKLAGPLAPVGQHLYVWNLGRTMRRILRAR